MKAGELLSAARVAAFVPLAHLTGGAPVLVLSPHPDDHSLGCGGLIAACVADGIPVEIALLTDASAAHPDSADHTPSQMGQHRVAEMRCAMLALGMIDPDLHEMGWRDSAAPRRGTDFTRAVAQLVALIQMTQAGSIVAAWGHDPHRDHDAGAAIAMAAARFTGIRHWAYPVCGWTLPDDTDVSAGPPSRLDVRIHLDRKRSAVACHRGRHGVVLADASGSFALPLRLLDACLRDHEVFFDLGRSMPSGPH